MEPPDRRRVRRLAGGRGRSRVGRRRLRDRRAQRGDPGRRGAGVGGRDRSVCRLRRRRRGASRRSSSPLRRRRRRRDPAGGGRGRRRGVGTRPQLRPGSRRGPRRDAPRHAAGRCCGGLCLGLRGRHGAHPPVLGRRDRARPGGTRARRGIRFPICAPGPLQRAFESAGLAEVEVRSIDVPTVFRDFDDYWTPFLSGVGPAPGYAAALDPARRDALRERLDATLRREPDGRIALTARAWAVRGRRP